jgi:tetratricopeptide (TPR) repeat protein
VKAKVQEDMVAADNKARLLQDAEKFMLQGKIQQAISEYQKIIKSDPNDVLILNTIGDLYLRQGDSSEANKCFSLVAENYVRNNFFLKAIAVYKKILNTDSNKLDINLTVASLCAKQGLNIDARNQYLRIAAIYEKEGKARDTLEILEKIVELDPANAAIQRKLAELYLAQNAKDKAHFYFSGAARAQSKAGKHAEAADSFKRAMQLNPLDQESMRGFLDCCLSLGDAAPALDQLKKSLAIAPDNLDFREMLGRAYLAGRQPDLAINAFQLIVSTDESRYSNFFDVAQAFLDAGEFDRAAACLDPIVSILISRRETDRVIQFYEQILQRQPSHIATLTRLAFMFFATDNQRRYIKALDEIANTYLNQQCPAEALEYIEKILQADPESEKYRELHRTAFAEAYPNTVYTPPAFSQEQPAGPVPIAAPVEAIDKAEKPTTIVEIDLLLNYGMREKALHLLQNIEAADPSNKEARIRLYSLFKEEKKSRQAAEQCILLSILCRRSMDEESAQRYWTEAQQLDPDLTSREQNLEAFARRHGLLSESPGGVPSLSPNVEVDLSGDLLDIFFSGNQEVAAGDEPEPVVLSEAAADNFSHNIPSPAPAKSLQEQLQEVDFYIRLGFNDEALSKLNEIAKLAPDNPELISRYQKLGEVDHAPVPEQAAQFDFSKEHVRQAPESAVSDGVEKFPDFDIDAVLDKLGESQPEKVAFKAGTLEPQSSKPAKSLFQFNEMFSDLLEEVSSLTDQEISMETFENHFGLGIAYREMDLTDDAIKEFQIALRAIDVDRDPQKVIQCCGMLSTCYIKKGMPRSVLRWCQTGLSVPDLSSHEALALRYDMGVAHVMAGSSDQALECFDKIFAVDPSYRDVAQKIDELKGGFKRHAP